MATRTNEREKDRGHRGLKLVLTTDGRNRQPTQYAVHQSTQSPSAVHAFSPFVLLPW